MPKVVERRTLRIELTIHEKVEGSYSNDTVANQQLTVELPVDRATIERTIGQSLDMLVGQVELFRGTMLQLPAPETAEVKDVGPDDDGGSDSDNPFI